MIIDFQISSCAQIVNLGLAEHIASYLAPLDLDPNLD
jgi:hypothetical protein